RHAQHGRKGLRQRLCRHAGRRPGLWRYRYRPEPCGAETASGHGRESVRTNPSGRRRNVMSALSDWRQLPLGGSGRSLVEASAGTGKTWTIGVLYLRLLLEEHFLPPQIVVATFTKAAAAELRERLRKRLVWAI